MGLRMNDRGTIIARLARVLAFIYRHYNAFFACHDTEQLGANLLKAFRPSAAILTGNFLKILTSQERE
jgi:hypothetical protein